MTSGEWREESATKCTKSTEGTVLEWARFRNAKDSCFPLAVARGAESVFLLVLLCAANVAKAQPETIPAPAPNAHHQVSRPSVTLTLADPSPVIGVTGETLLRIVVSGPPETPMPLPRVLCSVGQVEDLGREGPANFTARYILPAGRYPQPAIIVAEFDGPAWNLRGVATIRLRAATTPALHTDPGAQVTLRVGDRDFGPQVAPADGMVHIPIVVPPGLEFATARSVNQYGKATEEIVDLRVPYSQRVLFAAPTALVAGRVAEVAVYAVEPSGRPADGASLILRASGAKVQPLGGRIPGEARFLVHPPSILREKGLRIEAQLKGQSTTRIVNRIALVPGRATWLTLEPEASYLGRKPGSSLRVFLGAEDVFGNPVDAGRANVLIDGVAAQVKADTDGEPMIVVKTPVPAVGRGDVMVEGVLDMAHATRRIPIGVQRRRPWPVPTHENPSPRYALTPRLGVLWNLHDAAGATLFVDAIAFRSARHPDLGLGLSLGLVQSWFVAENANGITRTSQASVPVLVHIRRRFRAGQAFLGLEAGAGFAIAWARFHSYGATIVGTSHGVAAEAGLETGFWLRHGQFVASLRYLAIYLDTFSSGDRIQGNAAGAVLDIGYRLGF